MLELSIDIGCIDPISSVYCGFPPESVLLHDICASFSSGMKGGPPSRGNGMRGGSGGRGAYGRSGNMPGGPMTAQSMS